MKTFILHFFYLFGRRFEHCTGHITTGSWKGRGNQYIEFARVLYCKLLTNVKQLPAFLLEPVRGEKLYTAPLKQNDENLDELFLSNEKIKTLINEDKQIYDAPISIECGRALKLLKNNKSPGYDGFPAEFYKFF